ncbi:MAG: hypothetical protein BWY09_02996 [Candidatus Hydrogenedentes bacterium ADurb.Bin179]|nr:MAG: hypothetical protein BWY09_02996 [Candidatus Hydrogenedentes bacterium ADurb.Bin179]
MPVGIKVDVFDVYQAPLRFIIANQSGIVHFHQRCLQYLPRGGAPGFAEIGCFNVIYVGARIGRAAGMIIESRDDATVLCAGYLVMAAHARQFPVLRPGAPVNARFPVQLPAFGVFGEAIENALAGNLPGLGISHFLFSNAFESTNAVRFHAPVLETHALAASPADEHPHISLFIEQDTAVVMGVIYPVLVVNDSRFGHGASFVIIVSGHNEQVPVPGAGGASINKEGLVRPGRVHRQWNMLGCVGAQSARVFVAILALLAQRKPDAFVAVRLGAVNDRFRRGKGGDKRKE